VRAVAGIERLPYGELLRRYRVAAGLTQEALAERARVSADTISALERGINHAPRKDTANLLAEALALAPHARATFDLAAQRRTTPVLGLAMPAAFSFADSGSPGFVGRARELSLVEHHLAGAGAPVLLLSGEPGIGKTRLLREAAALARSVGWTVLEGGCQRRGGQEPYAPLLRALQRCLRHLPPAQVRSILHGCEWLVRLLPELVADALIAAPEWALSPEQELRLMFAAVGRFLANVAGPAGTLLILDDLQWADADALDLIACVLRTDDGAPVRMLGAYRDTEFQPEDPLAAMVADLVRDELATQATLEPLAPHEAAELLHAMWEDAGSAAALTPQVLQRTGGVPFFLISCARALREEGGRGASANAVPWDVAQAIRQRITLLPALAQRLLGIAAVVGRVVAGSLLVRLTPEPEADVLAALAACCHARLLAENGDDDYCFPHDIIREVLEADLHGGQRRLLHRQVAAALEQMAGEVPLERLAYHYARGGDQEKAVGYLERAGDRAMAIHAHAEAESHYRELVEHLDELARPLAAAAAREKLSAVLVIRASYNQALDVLDRAAADYQAHGEIEGWGRATAQIGWVHARRGTAEEGIRRLRELLAGTGAHGLSPQGLADLYVALAQLYTGLERYDDLLDAAARAATLARQAGDERALGKAQMRRAAGLVQLGRGEEACQVLAAALVSLERANDLSGLAFALNLLAMTHATRGEMDLAGGYAERALAAARRLGDPQAIAFMAYRRSMQTFYAGRWQDALSDLEGAVQVTRQLSASAASAYPLFGLGRLRQVTGQYAAAAQHLAEASGLAIQSRELQARRLIQRALAEQDLLEGRPDAARARLLPLLDQNGHEESNATLLLPFLAWAESDLGDSRAAVHLLEQGVARATREQNRLALVDVLRIQGLVASRQGNWQQATQALADALALSRSMPYPYAEGKALYVLGQMHAHHGELPQARQQLDTALAVLGRLGERLYAERAEHARAALPSS
jgi:transcriptional regulator with XRE-family HTH domain/tetratricopeptide (TPR) repeat protein